ncbi:MAG: pantoate--beta-alanine ligase [Anaerotignaceae bacterium]
MKTLVTIAEVRENVKVWKRQGLTVGLVPTMGYLHNGHKSLIKKAHEENDKVVVSIFVNPIQFGVNEDLDSYPRDLESDSKLCDEAGVDIIFHPQATQMYFKDFCTFTDMESLTHNLCGMSRPTHFRGVCTVVNKLFNIVTPDRAYFGQKDAQQLAIIKRMVRDLNIDTEIIECPIVREEDGLAISSRNSYLSAEERKAALVLSRSLAEGRKILESGERNAQAVVDTIKAIIEKEPFAKIDYVKMVDSDTLEDVEFVEKKVLVAMAVFVGKTRLIDNITF